MIIDITYQYYKFSAATLDTHRTVVHLVVDEWYYYNEYNYRQPLWVRMKICNDFVHFMIKMGLLLKFLKILQQDFKKSTSVQLGPLSKKNCKPQMMCFHCAILQIN